MNIKSEILTFCLIAVSVSVGLANEMSSVDREKASELARWVGQHRPFRAGMVRTMTQEQKTLLREHYQDKLLHDRGADKSTLPRDLALLGDDEARGRLVLAWLSSPFDYPLDLIALEDPCVISEIGDLLFLDEAPLEIGDLGHPPRQYEALTVILPALKESPLFSDKVREWAQRLKNSSASLDSLRLWYRKNENLLKARKFEMVEAGIPPREVDFPAMPDMGYSVTRSARAQASAQEHFYNRTSIYVLVGGILFSSFCLLVFLFKKRGVGRRGPA